MKNLFIAFAFLLSASFAFANETTVVDENKTVETTISAKEYITIGMKCYVRWCWLEGTTKVCTSWQEVPCDKGLSYEQGTSNEE